MILVKDFFASIYSRYHGKYEFTAKQNRVLDDYMDALCTACMLDAVKEWEAESASV